MPFWDQGSRVSTWESSDVATAQSDTTTSSGLADWLKGWNLAIVRSDQGTSVQVKDDSFLASYLDTKGRKTQLTIGSLLPLLIVGGLLLVVLALVIRKR